MSVKITWFGHATLGIEVEQFHILIDPFFANNPTAVVNAEDVAADFILVTHGHGDHIGDTVDIAKRTGALVISNAEICAWLKKQGVPTHAQQIGGGHQHPFGYLKLTQAVHGSALPDGSYGGNPAGFLLRMANGKHIYLAGDTGLFGDMRLIGEEGVALAVLPIGDNYTMGPADALRAVRLLQPEHVIPIHFSTWGLIQADAQDWAAQVERETTAKAHVLAPGGSFSLP